MPPTSPSCRYDLPWKIALRHAFHPFMDFYFPDFSAAIDWTQAPRLLDKELAGVGIGAASDVMVADHLVEVRIREGGRRALVHIEIQAQRDVRLGQRVYDYNYRISKAYSLPVNSLVLLADEDSGWRPGDFLRQARITETRFSFETAKLLDHAADMAALAASHNPIAWVTQAHVLTQQAHHDPDKLYAAKLHMTKRLFLHRWSRKRIIWLFNVVNWMMVLPAPYQRRYWRAVSRIGKEREMKLLNPLEQMFVDDGIKKGLKQGRQEGLIHGLEKGREEGREEGREQGREEGRAEGAVALLERQLIQRFGPLPKTAQVKLAKASVAQVEAWSDALVVAESLKQVFGATR
jgi:hypothetical protein